MKGISPDQNQPSLLYLMLRDQLNPNHPLFLLSEKMPWRKIEKEVLIDTTVQEKNITFPTDSKLYVKIIKRCIKIAEKEEVTLRQSYHLTVKKLLFNLRFMHHPRNRKKARAANLYEGTWTTWR